MESVYVKPQMQQQQHRRGQIMRYNSVDNRLLSSPYDPTAYMYSNPNLLVVPSYYRQSHKPVQQFQAQPPLLPFPIATRPHHSTKSLPVSTSRGKLNNAARKFKSHDHSAGNSKNNHQKIKGASSASCMKEKLVSKKISTQPDREISNSVLSEDEDRRVVSDLVFALSPHPSSLPIPKFFIRQRAAKLSCKAEARIGDGGSSSTEGLTRVLQLH